MGLLVEAFNPTPRASSWNESAPATSDFWYRDPSGYVVESGGAGIALSHETILHCGTVLAAVRFRGDSWAMCPPSTYRKTPTGRVEEPGHYSQRVLRNPNRWQTGNRWRHIQGVWMALWGNGYSEIRAGSRSFADELWPMHPSYCRVVDQRTDGSLLYRYTPMGEDPRTFGQEKVLHFRDLSTDGISGVDMYWLIRNVVGIALLAEKHKATFLKKGARLAGLLVPTGVLGPEERKTLKDSVNSDLSGPSNTGTFGVMPFGVDLKQIASTNRDSQLSELSDQTVGAILRFLGVPGVVVGYMGDKTATYASAEAFFEKGGLKHCVLPILINVEAEEEKSLLLSDSGHQIKHNMDILERANLKDRTEALVRSIGGPFRTVNEGRRIEDMNELADERYDEVLTPANMSTDPEPEPEPGPPPAPFRPARPPEDDEEDPSAHADLLSQYAHDNAVRVVRREVKAIMARAPKHARDSDGWKASVLRLYGEHAEHVAEVMRIPKDQAMAYCDSQAAALLAGGAKVIETWEAEIPPRLVALALERE